MFGVFGASILDRPTLFGGALLGQALQAAVATIPYGYSPHHLHGEFPRAGRSGEPTTFAVDRTKDGRSVSGRRVVGRQGDRVIVTLEASFHRGAEPGPDFHIAAPTPFPAADLASGVLSVQPASLGLEVIDTTGSDNGREHTEYQSWYRWPERLPDDFAWHASVLAFASDLGVPSVAVSAVGLKAGGPDNHAPGYVATTSLNHTMWFHREGRCDDWFLITGRPLSTSHGRGVSLGTAWDVNGVQIASIVQEILIK